MSWKERPYSVLVCTLLAASLPTIACGQAVTGLAAVRVATGLDQPLYVTAPPGDFNRLFIVLRNGRIRILKLDTGLLNQTAFLDISSIIATAGERGLLGMAFDPNYGINGKFYLNFLVAGGAFNNGKTRISQFSVSNNKPDLANPNSEKILLTYDQARGDHNGGWLGFSPRPNDANNLYIAVGDGGCCNDQGTGHLEPGGNAQNLTTLLGKMLRIHVNSTLGTYTVPPDNPFISTAGARGEIWAYGLRNPFRDSFDRINGRMYIADVGQGTREEIDVQEATNPSGGENFEWRLREGFIATPTGNPLVGGDRPADGIDPIFDYNHFVGSSVIGGYVYRGKQIPGLQGRYLFADYVSKKVWVLSYDGTTVSNFQDITSQLFPSVDGYSLGAQVSFGEDANGELYICDYVNGSVFKIVPVTPNVRINAITRNLVDHDTAIEGLGVPFTDVTIEASPMMAQPFQFLGIASTAPDGTFSFQDATNLGARFYRVTYP